MRRRSIEPSFENGVESAQLSPILPALAFAAMESPVAGGHLLCPRNCVKANMLVNTEIGRRRHAAASPTTRTAPRAAVQTRGRDVSQFVNNPSRRYFMGGAAALVAAPFVLRREALGQSGFNWKRFSGETIDVLLVKNPRSDL